MQLIAQTIVETTHSIIDADISERMTAVLLKGKHEQFVQINGEAVFKVSQHIYMLRIVGEALVLYDGQYLYFYTLDGQCTQQVTVGRHISDLFPLQDAVVCTYSDEGIYEDPIGQETIHVVNKDGSKASQLKFANRHQLTYDLHFVRVKPFACLNPEMNEILHIDEQFQLSKTTPCNFDVGNVLAMSYQYPYFLFVEENKWLCLKEDGTLEEHEQPFSYTIRGNYHRGPLVFIEIFKHQVVGYSFVELD